MAQPIHPHLTEGAGAILCLAPGLEASLVSGSSRVLEGCRHCRKTWSRKFSAPPPRAKGMMGKDSQMQRRSCSRHFCVSSDASPLARGDSDYPSKGRPPLFNTHSHPHAHTALLSPALPAAVVPYWFSHALPSTGLHAAQRQGPSLIWSVSQQLSVNGASGSAGHRAGPYWKCAKCTPDIIYGALSRFQPAHAYTTVPRFLPCVSGTRTT